MAGIPQRIDTCTTPGCSNIISPLMYKLDTNGRCRDCHNKWKLEEFRRKMAKLRGVAYAPLPIERVEEIVKPAVTIIPREENTIKILVKREEEEDTEEYKPRGYSKSDPEKLAKRAYRDNPQISAGIRPNLRLLGQPLSKTENGIVVRMCKGMTRRQIADEMKIPDPSYISTCLRRVVQKWGLRYKDEVVGFALVNNKVNVKEVQAHYEQALKSYSSEAT